MDAGQGLVTWMGLAVLEKVQGEGQGVFLGVSAMAVPVWSIGMPHGVTNTDHSLAWDFVVCSDLRERWMLLALPTARGGLPWWNPGCHQRVGQKVPSSLQSDNTGTIQDMNDLGNEPTQLHIFYLFIAVGTPQGLSYDAFSPLFYDLMS